METKEFITLLGFIIVIVGWLVSYFLARKKDRDFEKLKWTKSHLDQQLSEFYGPIYGFLLENDRLRQVIQEQFGRIIIFEGGNPLTEEEQKIWILFLETYFLPNNRKIIDILTKKVHLLQGYQYPKSFLAFLDYAIGFEALHKQYLNLGKEYGFHQKINFPIEFREEVIKVMSSLKKKQWEIVKQKLPPSHGNIT
jgi:hypothetical protein